MFTKVLLVAAVAAVALAIDYPPGIHPAVCPNFPYCDAELLARYTPEGMPIPDWEMPAIPVPAEGAARYPADFDPALCPNYPYCF